MFFIKHPSTLKNCNLTIYTECRATSTIIIYSHEAELKTDTIIQTLEFYYTLRV